MSRPIVPPAAPFQGAAKNPAGKSKTKKTTNRPAAFAPRQPYFRRLELMSSQSKLIFRMVVLALVTGNMVSKTFLHQLLPYGSPVELVERPKPLKIDKTDTLLQFRHGQTQRIYQRMHAGEAKLLNGPETVVIHPKTGDLYVMTADANLLLLRDLQTNPKDATRGTAQTTRLHSLGSGRPLGGAFTRDGKTLYIADAVLGLTRIQNPTDPKSKLELVVDEVAIPREDGTMELSRLWYADDVTIGPKTGMVYFTDASDIPADRIGYQKKARWDALFASKLDLVRGQATGRILEYNPTTDTTRVLVDNLKFANGIAVDRDETYLLVSQTFGPRMSKYHLKGDLAGTLEAVLEPEQMTGYPDGADCAWDGPSKCFAAIPSAYSPIHSLYSLLPDPLDRIVRVMLMMLPRWLAPPVTKYGGIVEMDPDTKDYRYIQDPTGQDLAMLTGVTYHNNKLYLGSLENDYIGVYTLQATA